MYKRELNVRRLLSITKMYNCQGILNLARVHGAIDGHTIGLSSDLNPHKITPIPIS
ncbi:hypothetical protein HanIR_Chr11g0550651 [Helianthus annuus]|nr:hypothetical protein HanIR_Chr11g0550651 [Helianthus annuus]